MEPLKIVQVTPPLEAILRILLNSVPYLIGAAVVRQPAGPDAVAADVGRSPWLFDRRLTSLDLPEDALPGNRPVTLDWPVPYQAEWVGVGPRLLIARLVFGDRTVGVLLGTLTTRDQLNPQTREAIELSCELIASAVAMDTPGMYVAPPPGITMSGPTVSQQPARTETAQQASVSDATQTLSPVTVADAPVPDRDPRMLREAGRVDTILKQVSRAAVAAGDARGAGRVLRDAINDVMSASMFTVALFHAERHDVAYRYKVAAVDAGSSELGRHPVDDGVLCAAVRAGDPWHTFARDVVVGREPRRVAVLQVPIRNDGEPIGVVTVQAFRDGAFAEADLELVAAIVDATAPVFASARAAVRYQPVSEPEFALSRSSPTGPNPAAAGPAGAVALASDPPDASPTQPSTVPSVADPILVALLEQFASTGVPTAFVVGLDVAAGMLRGEIASTSAAASGLDAALGISSRRFAISLDDRNNAIARACREARVVAAPTVHELVQPAFEWSKSLDVEQLVGGGHSTIFPITVNGTVVGAAVAGPGPEAADAAFVERLQELVTAVAHELAGAWRAASSGDTAGQVVAEDSRLRSHGARSVA